MKNLFKHWFSKKKAQSNTPILSPKEIATQNNEPYIEVIKVELDSDDLNNGSFTLDWNDKFLLSLIRAGYKKKESDTDAEIVDRWFTNVCRNVVLEVYEQENADPDSRDTRNVKRKEIGDGRVEIQ